MEYVKKINQLLKPKVTENQVVLDLFAGCGGKFFRGITYLEGTEKNWAAVWQHYLNPFTLVLLSLYVTTQSIYRIGWVNNQATLFQHIYHLLNSAGIRIVRVDFNESC